MPKLAPGFSATASESYKLFVFTLSACMAGIAGALYVPQVGIINPSEFAPGNSIEAVIWVAVGGRGTLVGAAVGAILVNYAKTYFTSGVLAPYWLFMLGGLFIGVTLLLPRGIIGSLHHWTALRRARISAAAEDGVAAPPPNRSRRNEVGHEVQTMRKPKTARRPSSARCFTSKASRCRSTASARSTISPSPSSRARCAPSSARTAPARRP